VKLHDLHPTPGSRTPSRRVGRGHGSGRGKTAGRGTKGQKSRAGGNLPAWFEGGQTPLHIRTPKLHGFRNRGRVAYAPLNLGKLGEVEKGTLVTPDVLAHDGLIRDTTRPVKILGVGEAPTGITIHAHAFSRSALDKLAAAGSTVQQLTWPDNAPVDPDAEAKAEADAAARTKGRKAKGRRAAAARAGGTAAPAAMAEPDADDEDGEETDSGVEDTAAAARDDAEHVEVGETEGGPQA
jgi:large subunit ribosomal protein L15